MKLREFWIDPKDIFGIDPYHEGWLYLDGRPEAIKFREVSPELDAAYAECEKVLESYAENTIKEAGSYADHIERQIEEASCISAREALTTLRKARE